MQIFQKLMEKKTERGGGFFLLLDPDRASEGDILNLAEAAEECSVDAILVGTSFMLNTNFHHAVKQIKEHTNLPVIIFPGGHSQISPHADAILFTSLISGRNPTYLIEEQVKGAPLIKRFGVEPIATGYMIIESGRTTSVLYISNTRPIPRNKSDIAAAHALTAQYFGMKAVFMEAGSGADGSVPTEMITEVSGYIDIPIITGGGINEPEEARKKILGGASFVVVGNRLEECNSIKLMREFAEACHPHVKETV
jgi:putative glycerol-1-phosphate prenyltransferase